MLKPKNNYHWPELVEKAKSDTAFKERLFAEPKEVLKEQGNEIPSDIEITIYSYNEAYIEVFILPHPDDVDIIEPIDTWTRICQKAFSNASSKSDLISRWGYLIGAADHDESEEDVPDETLKHIRASRIKNFLNTEGEADIVNDIIASSAFETPSTEFLEDSAIKKHFLFPRYLSEIPTEWSRLYRYSSVKGTYSI